MTGHASFQPVAVRCESAKTDCPLLEALKLFDLLAQCFRGAESGAKGHMFDPRPFSIELLFHALRFFEQTFHLSEGLFQ